MQTTVPEPLRFIPFRKQDVIEMCVREGGLNESDQVKFKLFARLLQSILHFEFHQRLEVLKDAYAPHNPDRDTLSLDGHKQSKESDLKRLIHAVMNDANYEHFSEQALSEALSETSLFNLKLHIDLSEFDEISFFTRGANTKVEKVKKLFGLWKREVSFINFDRVLIYTRYKQSAGTESGLAQLKLFKNVPKGDIEMLFPNTRLGMRWIDKLMIAGPALVGGILLLKTKAGTTLLLLASQPGIWLGLESETVEINQAAILGMFAALGALGSFIWKQFGNFRHRKLKFMQTLSDNLYFKNLDNNAGVFHKLIDEAEEEECKEVLLAYYFLISRPKLDTTEALDQSGETFLIKQMGAGSTLKLMMQFIN